jgi:hypothetical protein
MSFKNIEKKNPVGFRAYRGKTSFLNTVRNENSRMKLLFPGDHAQKILPTATNAGTCRREAGTNGCGCNRSWPEPIRFGRLGHRVISGDNKDLTTTDWKDIVTATLSTKATRLYENPTKNHWVSEFVHRPELYKIPVDAKKSINPVILSVIHYRQNPLDTTNENLCLWGKAY